MGICLNGVMVGQGYAPYIVAEISANHNQSFEQALKIIDAAKATGASAVKIQTYTPDTMTLDCHGEGFDVVGAKSEDWNNKNLYSLYKEAQTPWEWHGKLFEYCKIKEIAIFSTPFDETAVDFLESLNCPFYKLASFEVLDLPLIRRIARTGKPLIASTGMANIAEIYDLISAFKSAGGTDLLILKCTSSYPASPLGSNLVTLPYLEKVFRVPVGLSDHTMGIGVSVAAVALGANFIEKHFILSRAEGGVDSEFSLEPNEMKNLVRECHSAWQALGEVFIGPTSEELSSKKYRRSLYITQDLHAGEILTEKNIRSIRPGLGLPPKYYENLIGKKINKDVKKGTPLSWDLV